MERVLMTPKGSSLLKRKIKALDASYSKTVEKTALALTRKK